MIQRIFLITLDNSECWEPSLQLGAGASQAGETLTQGRAPPPPQMYQKGNAGSGSLPRRSNLQRVALPWAGPCLHVPLPAGTFSISLGEIGCSAASSGDPSMKSGNGIPARCVYLEEMAADLDDQDWLDMDNVEQVGPPASGTLPTWATGTEFISSQRILNAVCLPKSSVELPGMALLEMAMGFLGYEVERGLEFIAWSPSSWRLQEFAAMQIGWGWGGEQIWPGRGTREDLRVVMGGKCCSVRSLVLLNKL